MGRPSIFVYCSVLLSGWAGASTFNGHSVSTIACEIKRGCQGIAGTTALRSESVAACPTRPSAEQTLVVCRTSLGWRTVPGCSADR